LERGGRIADEHGLQTVFPEHPGYSK